MCDYGLFAFRNTPGFKKIKRPNGKAIWSEMSPGLDSVF